MMRARHRSATFGIVGFGRFGRLWAQMLAPYGKVLVYDTKRPRRLPRTVASASLRDVASADFLFLAVPISELGRCCRQIRPLLGRRTLVLDTCSVKEEPVRIMRRLLPRGQPMLATHPLFGPDSASRNGGIAGFKIVVCRMRAPRALEARALSLFKKLSLKVIFSTPARHDRDMAPSQALVHLIGRGLAPLKLREQDIATPDYDTLLSLCRMVSRDTWQLFSDMQRKNRFASSLRREFMRNLDELDAKVADAEGPAALRREIDAIDRRLIGLLARRARCARRIGREKRSRGLPVYDARRERELASAHARTAERAGLGRALVRELFSVIMKHSRRLQGAPQECS